MSGRGDVEMPFTNGYRKGHRLMVRKRIRRILSGGAVVFIVLLCALGVSNAAFVGNLITYTISGSTGVPGATMTGLPPQNGQTVVTDQNGQYSAIVSYGWSGTVRPVKEGWTFEPASRPYQSVTANMNDESYVPTPITYTVSGRVTGLGGPMPGVEMRGLPGNPVTGADGSYRATVPYGWGETFQPVKEGFTFVPSNKSFPAVKSDQIQNFTAEAIKLVISGNAGTSGVKMKGLTGEPVTGANGVFSVKVEYGWTGTITPEKEGYQFEPTEMSYNNIITDQTNQIFNANVLTYVISGTTGLAGVEMKGLPGNPYTDENGYFTATVNHGFSGTVTPTKEGYKFDPASSMLTQVNSDRTNQNYTAEKIKVTISGTTQLEGVEMIGLPGNIVTGRDGSYSVTVEYGWSGTVMPVKDGYTFNPENKPYPLVTANMPNENYVAKRITYVISGNTQVPGVTIGGLPAAVPVVSGPTGEYTATVEHGWSGTITPSKEGYRFEPPSARIDNLMGSQSGLDFMPALLQRKISGTIRTSAGEPVANVTVLADNNGGQAITDAAGQYELSIGHGWSGKVAPVKDGYTFTPASKPYPTLRTDQLNQVFIANPKMFNVSGEVKIGNVPIEGVLITATGDPGAPITTTTDVRGKYSFKVPFGWTGEVAPTKAGINFNPPSQSLIDVMTDIVDFQPVIPKEPEPTVVPPARPTPVPDTTTAPIIDVPGRAPPPEVVVPAEQPPVAVTPQSDDMKKLMDEIQALKDAMTAKDTARSRIAAGPPADPGSVLISNLWIDNDLALEVLPAISEQAGIPIIAGADVVHMVTLSVENVPLDQVLKLVLAGTQYVYTKKEGYYLVTSAGLTDPGFVAASETRRVRLSYITAEAAVGLLSTAFKPYVQAELGIAEATVTPGGATGTRQPKTYTVLVTAPPHIMSRIIEDLREIDRMPDQVLLKARIVSMARTDLLNLGVEWGWPTINVGMFKGDNYGRGDVLNDFGGKSPWGIQIGYTPDLTFTNALQLALNLLTVNGEATIRAEPQVLALDGKQATMKVVNEEYFFLTADQSSSQFFGYTSAQLETIESGTTLTITPHIAQNDHIVLDVSVEVSDSIPQGRDTKLPIVTRRTADNTVTVQNGGTVALAGLTQEKSATTHRRTPGLSNLPLIGPLFNNSDDQTTSQEVAVFVTAYILPQSQAAAGAMVPQTAPVPAAPQRFSMPPSELESDRPLTDPSFNRLPRDRGLNQPLVDRDFNRSSMSQPVNRAPVDQGLNRPASGPAPFRPIGSNFQSELRESLSRNR